MPVRVYCWIRDLRCLGFHMYVWGQPPILAALPHWHANRSEWRTSAPGFIVFFFSFSFFFELRVYYAGLRMVVFVYTYSCISPNKSPRTSPIGRTLFKSLYNVYNSEVRAIWRFSKSPRNLHYTLFPLQTVLIIVDKMRLYGPFFSYRGRTRTRWLNVSRKIFSFYCASYGLLNKWTLQRI